MHDSSSLKQSSLHLIFFSLLLFLASCTYQVAPQPASEDTSPALFSDADIDGAELDLASHKVEVIGEDEGTAQEATELPGLARLEDQFSAQAVLLNSPGFIYYIQENPNSTTQPFSLFRYDQSSDVNTRVYGGRREIQAVAGSVDGNTILVSMRQTTSSSSDFEIFRLRISPARTQQLTSNTEDDTNVSVSGDGLKIAWQQAVSGKATLIIRSYSDTDTTTNFQESTLTRTEVQRQPSLSGSGRFIALVREITNNRNQVLRFDTRTNRYLTVVTSSATLEHPSISNDGNQLLYLQQGTADDDVAILRNLSAATAQPAVTGAALEHPFLTPDGRFVTYGLLQNGTLRVFSKDLTTAQELRLTNPASPVNHKGMTWAVPLAVATKLVENGTGQYGSSVSISGNFMVVGSRSDSYDVNGDNIIDRATGSAYIYRRNALGQWIFVKRLTPSDGSRNISFGSSVAISGTTIVVGAPTESHDTDGQPGAEFIAGAAYIFEKDQGGSNTWGAVKKIVASDGSARAEFGNAVAISANTVVVGAFSTNRDVNGNGVVECTDTVFTECGIGAGYLFERDEGGTNNWGEVKKFIRNNASTLDNFGRSVGVSGDTVVVGACTADPNVNGILFDAGVAHVFERNRGGTNNWGEVKELVANDAAIGDNFGCSVAISDTTIIVGALVEDHDVNGIFTFGVGAAYLFEKDQGGASNWGQTKKLVAADGAEADLFGSSVAISGNTVAVGATRDDTVTGSAYVFARDVGGTNNWGNVKKLLADDGVPNDSFGEAVALSDKTVVVGVRNKNNFVGAAYLFE